MCLFALRRAACGLPLRHPSGPITLTRLRSSLVIKVGIRMGDGEQRDLDGRTVTNGIEAPQHPPTPKQNHIPKHGLLNLQWTRVEIKAAVGF